MHDPILWMTGQLGARQEPAKAKHTNPRPPGVIHPGSGTDVLLRFMRLNPGRWFMHSELVLSLGRTKGEIDWALQHLVLRSFVESKALDLPGRKPVQCYRLGDPDERASVGYRELRRERDASRSAA